MGKVGLDGAQARIKVAPWQKNIDKPRQSI